MSEERIKFALDLAKEGQKEDARNILRDVLKQDRDNALAWGAYARVAENKEQAIYALEQILRIRPGDEWAMNGLQKIAPDRLEQLPEKVTEKQKEPTGLLAFWTKLSPRMKFGVGCLTLVILVFCSGTLCPGLNLFSTATSPEPDEVEEQEVMPVVDDVDEVGPTETPLPTDIPAPTNTPQPTDTPALTPTATPGPSAEVVKYKDDILEEILTLYSAMEDFGELSSQAGNDPLLMFDDDWRTDMIIAMALIKAVHIDVEEMDVPAEVEDIHQVIVDGTSDCDQAMDLVAEGIDELDADLMSQGSELITTCGEKVADGLTQLDEYMENPGTSPSEASADAVPTEEENPYPGCPDMNCTDFDRCEDVLEYLDYCPSQWGDLDHDSNGVPCESLCG